MERGRGREREGGKEVPKRKKITRVRRNETQKAAQNCM